MIDDKPRILQAIKRAWGDRGTTVFPRQGGYATDADQLADFTPVDITIDHTGDMSALDFAAPARR